jgi:hypothetical protein
LLGTASSAGLLDYEASQKFFILSHVCYFHTETQQTEQVAEKLAFGVILSEAKNLSSI